MRESMPAKNAGSAGLYHGFPPARERRYGELADKIPSQSAAKLPDLG
jgi:trans-aconitate methyltransferase